MNGNLTVYKASAGSGKTFTLAAEYISRALSGETGAYAGILAVTFTNKATAEMKERILQRLFDLWKGISDPASDNFLKAVSERMANVSVDDIRRRAGNVLRAIVHDYDHFRVETIDSFFQSLLSNLAHELNLSANFKVDINDREMTDAAVDRVLQTIADRRDVLSWVLSYVKERIENDSRWDITREVKAFSRNLSKEKYLMVEDRLQTALGSNENVRQLKETLRGLAAEAGDFARNAAEQLTDMMEQGADGFKTFKGGSYLRTYLSRILRGEGTEPTDSVRKLMEDSNNWLRASDKKNRHDLAAWAEELRGYLNVVEDLRRRAARVENSCFLTTFFLNPLRLLNEIDIEMDALNKETGHMLLAKTPLLFYRLVDGSDAPFVFEKAGTTFQHVMIDEFQDTSRTQWSNFKTLLVENLSASNGCLLVGDVKQSIYRFREGDWRILQDIGDEFPAGNVDIKTLDTNFRSAPAIVRFNNRFFARAASLLDTVGSHFRETLAAASAVEQKGKRAGEDGLISQIYSDVAQRCKNPEERSGYVRVSLTPTPQSNEKAESEEEMLADLVSQVEQLHSQGLPYGKMAILLRQKTYAAPIIAYFSQHLPEARLISEEAFLLSSSKAVCLLVCALRCLADPSDTIAEAYLRSRCAAHIEGSETAGTIVNGSPTGPLPEAFTSQLSRLRRLPLYELLEELISLFRLDRVPTESAFLFTFLDRVGDWLEDNPSDLSAFLEYWNESLADASISAGEDFDGIRIVTIHKSKGLAYHTVLLPFCEWSIERDRPDSLIWCESQEKPYDALPLVPVPGRYGSRLQNSVYAADYAEEHFQRRVDNLNLLYVAFTRAEKNLYVWARGKNDLGPGSTVGDLLARSLCGMEKSLPCVFEDGAPITMEKAEEHRPAAAVNPLEVHPEMQEVRMQTFPARMEFRQSNRSAQFLSSEEDEEKSDQDEYISRGKLLHHLFSSVATATDVDGALARLRTEGILDDTRELDAIAALIHKRMSDPRVASWFDGSWQLYNECSILSRTSDGQLQVRRPDRVMLRGEETVVVDFKFGRPREEYAHQVAEYMQLVKRMGRTSVKGFLWYVYSGEVIEIASQ